MTLQGEANWLVEALREMAVKRDSDLTLLLFKEKLDKIHFHFFKNVAKN